MGCHQKMGFSWLVLALETLGPCISLCPEQAGELLAQQEGTKQLSASLTTAPFVWDITGLYAAQNNCPTFQERGSQILGLVLFSLLCQVFLVG